MITCEAKTAVILAGGRSSRFGEDKLMARVDGVPLLQILIKTLESAGFRIVIAGHRKYGEFGYPLLEDLSPFDGPLSALAGVFERLHVPKILLAAGDMPLIPASVIHLLWRESRGFDITLLAGPNGPSPLPGVYSKKTGQAAAGLLSEGRGDLAGLREKNLKVRVVSRETFRHLDPYEQSLSNINTVDDLENCRSAPSFAIR